MKNNLISDTLLSMIKEDDEIYKTGHFKMTSGKHCKHYVQKDKILTRPEIRRLAIRGLHDEILEMYLNFMHFESHKDLCIVSPSQAGIPWGSVMAYEFSLPFMYCEKSTDGMSLLRGFGKEIVGKSAIIVEDIVSTAGSVIKTANAIRRSGGDVIASVCIWNRGGMLYSGELVEYLLGSKGFPIQGIIKEKIEMYEPGPVHCPMCREGIPIQNPKS